jgi:hypothetical protein
MSRRRRMTKRNASYKKRRGGSNTSQYIDVIAFENFIKDGQMQSNWQKFIKYCNYIFGTNVSSGWHISKIYLGRDDYNYNNRLMKMKIQKEIRSLADYISGGKNPEVVYYALILNFNKVFSNFENIQSQLNRTKKSMNTK